MPNSLAVDPDYRGHSLRVVMPYLKQENADVLLITTAGPAACALFGKALKFSPMPYRGITSRCSGSSTPRPFPRSLVVRLKLPWPARVAGNAVLPALTAAAVTLARGAPRPSPPVHTPPGSSADEVGEDFEDLWRRKVKTDLRFMESRTPEALSLAVRGARGRGPVQIRLLLQGRHAGRVFGRRPHGPRGRARQATLCDLFVEGDEGPAVNVLLIASRDRAAGDGAAILEVLGLPGSVRARLAAFRPFRRTVVTGETHPYLYKLVKHIDAPDALRGEGEWYTRANDGDVGL